MASVAEAIILSSSPTLPMRTPTKSSNNPSKLPDPSPLDQAPPPLPSPSKLPCPTRSGFFPKSKTTEKTTRKKRQPAKKAEKTAPDEKDVSKAPPKTKKATTEPNRDPEMGSIDSRDNLAKKALAKKKSAPRTSKKAKDVGNMKLSGKVSKASDASQATTEEKAEPKSGSKAKAAAESAETKEPEDLSLNEALKLDEAMARRRDWTPPKETPLINVSAEDEAPEIRETGGFGSLLSDFNYAGSASDSCDIGLKVDNGGPTKRRRIEVCEKKFGNPLLVLNTNAPKLVDPTLQSMITGKTGTKRSTTSSPTKNKPPKSQKKFTTLTARMTAQYASNEVSHSDLMEDVLPDISKAKSRRKAKSAVEEPSFIVLSPEAATKALNDQDLIFGTCSQLEREDSPETLRELQQAIRESESISYSGQIIGYGTPTRLGAGLTGTKNLWGVASRDASGALVQAEKKALAPSKEAPSNVSKTNTRNPRNVSIGLEDDWLDLDLDIDTPVSSKNTSQLHQGAFPLAVNEQPPLGTTIPAPAGKKTAGQPASSSQQADSQRPSMPHYAGFTDAELSKQVATFGFKSVRGRKKMIDLLQKCWESKHGISDIPAEVQAPAPKNDTQKTEPAQKPKPKSKVKTKSTISSTAKDNAISVCENALVSPKKQRKPAKAPAPSPSFIDVDEIQDSEEEIFLSPSRVQQRYTPKSGRLSPERTLDILTNISHKSPAKRKPSSRGPTTKTTKTIRATKKTAISAPVVASDQATASRQQILPDLLTQITKAVRVQPKLSPSSSSTGSRKYPTWHEKILTYDPIILEDLATWLNVEGLRLVNEDREVSPLDVRTWCESKGICCCWKQNATW
ncbi:uncharacterized protein N7483_000587 [Penicillium malachiteum]|uniref:uncharacterized protein n=1 Tax=Penicillium malachiteum TaxID=1324776 RepID=UPI002546AD97|nr:uncharacterized protein N7483_000587 [Penicillium malachiteum]KAJ5735462.1 hypothetical protein N7483_000587 [Penicillium malachiteum]